MGYYIGVDGGGTKTAYALFDEKRRMLEMITGPGTNHEALEASFPEAAQKLWTGLNVLVERAGITINDVSFTLMGLAGVDHPYQHEILCDLLREKGLKRFEIFNDGFIVVKAGSETGAAIGYNCGTGTCCNAIDSRGNMLQLAGLAEFTGDTGGGDWIVERTFCLVYNELFLQLDNTIITKMVFEKYGISNREEFLPLVAKFDSDDADEYACDFIDFFFAAVDAGDGPAMKVCELMANRGAQFIAALAKQMDFDGEEIEVVLSGSMNVKLNSPTYLNMLIARAQELSGRKLRFTKLTKPPVVGCINWIMQKYAYML